MYRHSTVFFTNAVLAVTDSIFPHIKALECNAKLAAVGASFHITRLETTILKSTLYGHFL